MTAFSMPSGSTRLIPPPGVWTAERPRQRQVEVEAALGLGVGQHQLLLDALGHGGVGHAHPGQGAGVGCAGALHLLGHGQGGAGGRDPGLGCALGPAQGEGHRGILGAHPHGGGAEHGGQLDGHRSGLGAQRRARAHRGHEGRVDGLPVAGGVAVVDGAVVEVGLEHAVAHVEGLGVLGAALHQFPALPVGLGGTSEEAAHVGRDRTPLGRPVDGAGRIDVGGRNRAPFLAARARLLGARWRRQPCQHRHEHDPNSHSPCPCSHDETSSMHAASCRPSRSLVASLQGHGHLRRWQP